MNEGIKMRDKKRISRILTVLQEIWEYQPDVRFNQLVNNLQYLYSEQNKGYGKRPMVIKDGPNDVATHYLDFFYLEDEEWESFLVRYLHEYKQERQGEITHAVIAQIIDLLCEASIEKDKLSASHFIDCLKRYLANENKSLSIEGVVSFITYFTYEQRRDLYNKIMSTKGE